MTVNQGLQAGFRGAPRRCQIMFDTGFLTSVYSKWIDWRVFTPSGPAVVVLFRPLAGLHPLPVVVRSHGFSTVFHREIQPMTQYSRILVVFVAAAALAFMGFSLATYLGGPNWRAETQAEDLKDYAFVLQPGKTPTWQVQRRLGGGGSVANTPVAAEALIKTRQDLRRTQQEAIRAVDESLAPATARLEQTRQLAEQDLNGLAKRQVELSQLAAAVERQNAQLSDQLTNLSRRATATRAEASDRRADVDRLQNELELLRTDVARLSDLKKVLTERLIRLKTTTQSFEQRKQELLRQGARVGYAPTGS